MFGVLESFSNFNLRAHLLYSELQDCVHWTLDSGHLWTSLDISGRAGLENVVNLGRLLKLVPKEIFRVFLMFFHSFL